MSIVRRAPVVGFLPLAFVVLLLFGLSTAAFAQDEAPPETTTETTVAAPSEPVGEPAVVSPEPAAAAGPDDWTYRFLIPTLLALAVLVVVATTVQYFLQVVRKRYKVVE